MTGGGDNRREFLKASTVVAAGTVLASIPPRPGAARGTQAAPVTEEAGSSFAGGELRGRFVYDGEVPPRKPIVVTADKDFCGKHELFEEDLVVNLANRGISNVFVWIYVASGAPLPAVHSRYAAAEKADVCLDCAGCRFEPHALVLRTTQTLRIRNCNSIGDSAKIDTLSNPPINIVIPIKGEWRQTYANAERLPARVSCSLHPWETGWLLVKDHPYMAVSDADGRLAIPHLPPAKWTFQFWHEQCGYVTEVEQQGRATAWKRGRVEIEIRPGLTDLGELLLAPEQFAS